MAYLAGERWIPQVMAELPVGCGRRDHEGADSQGDPPHGSGLRTALDQVQHPGGQHHRALPCPAGRRLRIYVLDRCLAEDPRRQ